MPTIAVIFATFYCNSYLDNQERSRFSRLLDKDTFRNAWLDILTIKKGSGFYDCWTKSEASAQCARELPAKVKQGFSFSKRILYSTSVYALFLFCPISVKQGFSFSKRLCTHYWSDFLFSVKQGYSFSKRILYSTSVYAPSLVQCTFSSIITNLVWIGTGCTYSCGMLRAPLFRSIVF